jgi:hypothetical protein
VNENNNRCFITTYLACKGKKIGGICTRGVLLPVQRRFVFANDFKIKFGMHNTLTQVAIYYEITLNRFSEGNGADWFYL